MKYECFETKDANPQTIAKACNNYAAAGWTLDQAVPIVKKNGMTVACPTDHLLLIFKQAGQ